jgi:hypothetical protein
VSPDTACPDEALCGGECPKHEPDDVTIERDIALTRLRAESERVSAALAERAEQAEDNARAARHAAETFEADRLAGLAETDAETAALADTFTQVVTIDAWTERVALAAHRIADRVTEAWASDLPARPVIVVHPDDLAAMRRAHSASETDGPLHLFRMRVVADEHAPARTARLRYDVEVPL